MRSLLAGSVLAIALTNGGCTLDKTIVSVRDRIDSIRQTTPAFVMQIIGGYTIDGKRFALCYRGDGRVWIPRNHAIPIKQPIENVTKDTLSFSLGDIGSTNQGPIGGTFQIGYKPQNGVDTNITTRNITLYQINNIIEGKHQFEKMCGTIKV